MWRIAEKIMKGYKEVGKIHENSRIARQGIEGWGWQIKITKDKGKQWSKGVRHRKKDIKDHGWGWQTKIMEGVGMQTKIMKSKGHQIKMSNTVSGKNKYH
jgi:hypothetical protein